MFATSPLADSSKVLYERNIRRWLNLWKPGKTLEWLIRNPDGAMKKLRSSQEEIANTAKNHHCFLSGVVAYVRHELHDAKLLKEWCEIRNKNSEPINEHYVTGEPTERQKEKMIHWSEVIKTRDGLPVSEGKLLLGLYTYINPIRADYFACRLYESDPKLESENYMVLTESNPRLVLNDYKTKKKYGTIQIPIPPPLYELIKECKTSGLCKNDYLFTNSIGGPYDRSQYSGYAVRMLERIFDRPVTLTTLRHSYTSSLDYNRPIRELNEIARGMGHSVGVQHMYRWDGLTGCPPEGDLQRTPPQALPGGV
jgi:hypothetical protein